jgi:hypothetical protein
MKPKLIITGVMLLLSCTASYSQGYLITNTLPGNDSIAFTTLRYGRKDYGFGVISSKGIMNWQLPVPGYPLGMGKFKNNVVVFYTFEDLKSLTSLKNVHAAIIGLHEKKIIDDKIVYTNDSKYQVNPSVLNDPAGNFTYLLIRVTPLRGGLASMANNAETKLNETTQLSAISLQSNLTAHSEDLKSIALGSVFVTACVGRNDDLYVSSFSNDQLITEKFDSAANLKGKLSAAAPATTKKQFFPVITFDSLRGNCVDVAIAYSNNHKDDVMRSFRFDFNDQKATGTDEVALDKSYVKQLEKTGGNNSRLSNFKKIDELYPVQILETADKVIVLKEIQYHFTPVGDDAERFYREGGIISIYSKQDMHLQRDVVFDKYFGTFIMGGTGICSQTKDGKLYTVTCELAGAGKYKTYLYTININNGSMEKRELEKEDAGKGWITNPTTIAWFSNNFITPFNSGKAFIHLKFETDLQSENY